MHVIAPTFTASSALPLLIYCGVRPYAKYDFILHNHAWHVSLTKGHKILSSQILRFEPLLYCSSRQNLKVLFYSVSINCVVTQKHNCNGRQFVDHY